MMYESGLRRSKPLVRKVPTLRSRQGTESGPASTLVEDPRQLREAPPAPEFSFGNMNAGPMVAHLGLVQMGRDAAERRV